MGTVSIGLALSGGTAKSVAHIGVIKALEESGITIDYLSGTSGGSIVAVLYAAGRSIDELAQLAEGMRWRKLAGLTLPKLGLLSSEKIREFIVDAVGDLDFDQLRIPTAVVAADLTTGMKKVFREGKVALACQASSSIPEIYCPVEIDGHCVVDGGLIEYLPVETLASFGEIFKIGVNLGKNEGILRSKPRHLLEVIMQVTGFVSQQNATISGRKADFIISPDLERFGAFALHRASDIITAGYIEALKVLPQLHGAIRSYRSLSNRLKRLRRSLFTALSPSHQDIQ